MVYNQLYYFILFINILDILISNHYSLWDSILRNGDILIMLFFPIFIIFIMYIDLFVINLGDIYELVVRLLQFCYQTR